MAISANNIDVSSTIVEHEHAEKKTHHNDMGMMSLTDIKDTFKKDFMDEIEDSNKYCNMAHTAEQAGHEELARGLYEMSYEEYTHAKFIHSNLVDWGCEISEKEMMKWHELKERISRKFRS